MYVYSFIKSKNKIQYDKSQYGDKTALIGIVKEHMRVIKLHLSEVDVYST